VAAGALTVQLRNTGEDAHNLRIARSDATGTPIDIPSTAPQSTTTRIVTLAAGTYRLFCTLTAPSSHDDAGMHATLTVTG
jgi:plastocyanin